MGGTRGVSLIMSAAMTPRMTSKPRDRPPPTNLLPAYPLKNRFSYGAQGLHCSRQNRVRTMIPAPRPLLTSQFQCPNVRRPNPCLVELLSSSGFHFFV